MTVPSSATNVRLAAAWGAAGGVHPPSTPRPMKILNWIIEHDLDQLNRRGWIERQREPRPDERRHLARERHRNHGLRYANGA